VPLEPGEQIFAWHLEHAIHKSVKMIIVPEGQVALKNDAVKTAQEANDRRRKLVTER
jgi:hypothetical protein